MQTNDNKQLKAQSISIQVSNRTKCNGSCLFCISRVTPDTQLELSENDFKRKIKLCDSKRLNIGLRLAERLGASHGILTSKADPTQEDPLYLLSLIEEIKKYLPLVDMHTNGVLMLSGMPREGLLEKLADKLTMITFSIASFNRKINQKLMGFKSHAEELIPKAVGYGLLVRCSLVANKQGIADFDGVMKYIQSAGNRGAHMVVIRELWIPHTYGRSNSEINDWNKANFVDISAIQKEFAEISSKQNPYGLRQLDPLPWGTPVFAVEGIFPDPDHAVNVTFAKCDEATRGTVLKSIVHRADGHGYHNWDSRGSILY